MCIEASKSPTYDSLKSPVHRRNENEHGVNKAYEAGMISEAHTIVDPWAMVVHLHYTPVHNTTCNMSLLHQLFNHAV